jgi:hypothetical protein
MNPQPILQPSRDAVSERARRLWEAAGCPDGRDVDFWFRAEHELRSEAAASDNLDPTAASAEGAAARNGRTQGAPAQARKAAPARRKA